MLATSYTQTRAEYHVRSTHKFQSQTAETRCMQEQVRGSKGKPTAGLDAEIFFLTVRPAGAGSGM